MAKNDNLTDFLVDVADSIRTKKGYASTVKINPQNFSTEIASIVSSKNQNKIVTPTTSTQYIIADTGYTGLGTVTVNAMPTTTLSSSFHYADSQSNGIILSAGYTSEHNLLGIDLDQQVTFYIDALYGQSELYISGYNPDDYEDSGEVYWTGHGDQGAYTLIAQDGDLISATVSTSVFPTVTTSTSYPSIVSSAGWITPRIRINNFKVGEDLTLPTLTVDGTVTNMKVNIGGTVSSIVNNGTIYVHPDEYDDTNYNYTYVDGGGYGRMVYIQNGGEVQIGTGTSAAYTVYLNTAATSNTSTNISADSFTIYARSHPTILNFAACPTGYTTTASATAYKLGGGIVNATKGTWSNGVTTAKAALYLKCSAAAYALYKNTAGTSYYGTVSMTTANTYATFTYGSSEGTSGANNTVIMIVPTALSRFAAGTTITWYKNSTSYTKTYTTSQPCAAIILEIKNQTAATLAYNVFEVN